MKNILSHRGWWKIASEKNTLTAFRRSFDSGYGTETDFRDLDGELVVSHDPPRRNALPAREFFQMYSEIGHGTPLALNVKADGLQGMLADLIEEFQVSNYFVFDMAVPDGLLYLARGMNTFTRQSEVEPSPPFLDRATGVWLDEFEGHWISEDVIRSHLIRAKRVCIVSPELHKRSVDSAWADYFGPLRDFGQECLLCTDTPDQAEEAIYG